MLDAFTSRCLLLVGKDMYGFELYEQRYGLQREDAEGRRLKYRPNYEPHGVPSSLKPLRFWGAPILLLLNVPKSAVAGTFIDVGSYMRLDLEPSKELESVPSGGMASWWPCIASAWAANPWAL